MRFKPLAIVPVFGDTSGLDTVLERLASLRLDTLVVNDGNGETLTRGLQSKGYEVLDMGVNQGVGAAIQQGLRFAAKAGYSGVVCVDADDAYNEVAIAGVLSSAARAPSKPVLTCRFGHIGEDYIPQPKIAANAFAAALFEVSTGHALKDVASGLRYYPTPLAGKRWRHKRFDFVYEILNHILESGAGHQIVHTFVTYPREGPWLTKANELANLVNYCISLLGSDASIASSLRPLRDADNMTIGDPTSVTLQGVRFTFHPLPSHRSYLITQSPDLPRKFYQVDLPSRERLSLGVIPDGGRRWAKKNDSTLYDSYIKTFKSIVELLRTRRNQLESAAIYCLSLYNLLRPEDEVSSLLEALTVLARDLSANGWAPLFYGDLQTLPEQFRAAAIKINLQSSSEFENLPPVILCTAFSPTWQRWLLRPEAKPWELGLSPKRLQQMASLRLSMLLRSGGAYTLSDFLPEASSYAVMSFRAELFNDLDLESWWDEGKQRLDKAWYGV
jgi:undecaprenyl pyrophosphate synthase